MNWVETHFSTHFRRSLYENRMITSKIVGIPVLVFPVYSVAIAVSHGLIGVPHQSSVFFYTWSVCYI